MLKVVSSVLFSLFISACTSTTKKPGATGAMHTEVALFIPPGVDSTYPFSEAYSQYSITGYYNNDDIIDTAFLLRLKRTNTKAALYIKHGGINQNVLFRDGKALGQDFANFHWVGQFDRIEKGTIIWENVVNGEIVSEDQVPASKKVRLTTDAIFLHEDEGGGGGIVYFTNGRYTWMQQD